MKYITPTIKIALLAASIAAQSATARTIHVAMTGNDGNAGSESSPLRTIQRAADLAQPRDVVTVHSGTYRERVSPPRGGLSESERITYQAAPGEKVVITGSERVKGWEKVAGDTWKVTLPNKYFGNFNPFADLIRGDWYSSGRPNHTGEVYLDDAWLGEAANMNEVLAPAGPTPLWYAKVDGAGSGAFLVNFAWFKPGTGASIPAAQPTMRHGTQTAPCSEGGNCVGYIRAGNWLRYDNIDFGVGARAVQLRVASQSQPSQIELRLDKEDGPYLGGAKVASTGDWQKWATISAAIKPTSGKHSVCIVFKEPPSDTDNTTIWAQFKGIDPNDANVEISARKTVFTPEKTGINYITLRGFTLRNAATNWAPPTAGQIGLVTAYWCKGWIIEDNDIAYSRCCGIALGKYSDQWDNNGTESADGYVGTLTRALKDGWNKATVGSHLVRNNRISYCGQTGIVGSLGCSFSTVTGNEIHDIHLNQPFSGAEMAGIKFHGAIDVTISGNHIYRCGEAAGIWLDWMAQGAHVTGNLMHDNIGGCGDIFCEMQHGPILIANNILLSQFRSLAFNSQGVAVAHNLIRGAINSYRSDTRVTPFHLAHSTEVAAMYPAAKGDSGDHRLYNNLIIAPCNLHAFDNSALPCFAAGNVSTKGSQSSKFDVDALVASNFDPAVTLTQKADGWYLTINEDESWGTAGKRKLVTTELLGIAKVPNVPFENADGSPIQIDTDYFGTKRNANNPFPGPFEPAAPGRQEIKVWPIPHLVVGAPVHT